ncbi:MAG: hypothetical protein RLZZ129_2243 [Verrucomicrobiota bacterium]|jgi:O-antigen/teichoic acid export membrane protein
MNLPLIARTFAGRTVDRLAIDRGVGYLLAARICQIGFYGLAMVMIVRHLSPEEQGFYYTFFSLLSLQGFVDLGLAIVIINTASHEWPRLRAAHDRRIEGDPEALARLASLARVAVKWFGVGAIVFVPAVGLTGWYFFSRNASAAVAWQGPWLALVVLTAMVIALTPFNAILEGCNQVAQINRTRLQQTILEGSVLCLGLLLGAGLWVGAIALLARLGRNLVLLFGEYGGFFGSIRRGAAGQGIDWRVELWPMQWRLGVSGLVTYFLTSLYNPVMFHYHGAGVAGRMGITLQMTLGLTIVATSWVTPKVPRFGALIAQKNYAELDRLWLRSSGISLAMMALGAAGLWVGLWGLGVLQPALADRVLPPLATAIFFLAAIVAQAVQCLVFYLRAHKREPIMLASVSICVVTGLLVWWWGSQWGPVGAAAANLLVICLGGAWIGGIWRHCRRIWHTN